MKKQQMTQAHKDALAVGREQGRAVKAYLEVACAPKQRGRRRTAESVKRQLAEINEELAERDDLLPALTRLQLIQRQIDLTSELDAMTTADPVDVAAIEDAFVAAAKPYGERKGITRAAWREVGVPAAVLNRAGI